ncbi:MULTISPECIES: hypothetical protein [unclassified Streptomyces]|nr:MULTISPECIES: hypothetical protein [unclassified Streptomyces]MCW5251997.1 hypothetical protein [Streptomyces sp. SHP 1-2]MYU26141.1 hypothetical protein [Streptomyces sp. SID8352]
MIRPAGHHVRCSVPTVAPRRSCVPAVLAVRVDNAARDSVPDPVTARPGA